MLTKTDLSTVVPNLLATIGDGFPAQAAAVHADAKWTLIGAASRTGKTYAGARLFMRRVLQDYVLLPWGEEREYWCVAPSYKDCRAQKKELIDLIPDWMIDKEKQGDKRQFFDTSHGRGMLFLIGGAEIHLLSAEKPEGLVAFKVRGIWWTEIARSKYAAWPNVYSRLSNYADSWFIADTSPLGHCWFYKEVWKPARDGAAFKGKSSVHEWKAWDSPYIDPEVIEDARQNLLPEMFDREFGASWSVFAGQIYKKWDRKIHCEEACPFEPESVVIACDQNMGSQVDTAFVTFLTGGRHRDKHGRDRVRAHVEREFYQPLGLDYERYAEAILEEVLHWKHKGLPVKVVVDPAMLRDFKSMLRNMGITPHNAVNAVAKGIGQVGGALNVRDDGFPLLTVSQEKCPNLCEEFEGYKWLVSSAGVVSDTPDPASVCHALDCVRYGSMDIWAGFGEVRQRR